MPERCSTQYPLDMWQVERLRATAFPSPMAQVREPTWWSDLVGEPPETRTVHPRQGGSQEEGAFGTGRLVLRIESTRIDWLLTVAGEQKSSGEDAPTIGLFPNVLRGFQELIERWFNLETCPSVIRLAFGAVLLQPVPSLQDAYQQLGHYLPSMMSDPEGSSDFLYQINRRRDSITGIAGLKINRLSKWSAASFMTMRFAGSPERILYRPSMSTFFAQLELDINTALDFQGEFEKGQLLSVFSELVQLGCEIASQGDIP
jgi:hypothetical protein